MATRCSLTPSRRVRRTLTAVLPHGGRDLPIELCLATDQLALCDAALLFDAGLPPLREAALRDALAAHALPWSIVHGDGPDALEAALDAITFWPLRRGPSVPVLAGLFARLDRREQAQPRWRWNCDSCDSPECEHLSLAAARRPG